MTIGNRVKQKRLELGLTQDELASKAGIKQPSLNAIENGRAKKHAVINHEWPFNGAWCNKRLA